MKPKTLNPQNPKIPPLKPPQSGLLKGQVCLADAGGIANGTHLDGRLVAHAGLHLKDHGS